METTPPSQKVINLGILLLTTYIAIRFKGIDNIPINCLDILVDNRLIVDNKSFRLTRLGDRFIRQAEFDIYTYKWETKK